MIGKALVPDRKAASDLVLARMRQRLGMVEPPVWGKNALQWPRNAPGSTAGAGPGITAYSEDQERDESGKWAKGGGGYGKLPDSLGHDDAKWIYDPSWHEHKDWRQQAYGGVIVSKDGHFLLREPTNHFDGYHWTWPKGKLDSADEHPVDAALREVEQETGFKTRIFDKVPGTFKSHSGGYSSFFLMKPKQWSKDSLDWETQGLKWATYKEAKKLIGQSRNSGGRWRDLKILEYAHKQLRSYNKSVEAEIQAEFEENLHPRDDHGKFEESGGGAPKEKPAGKKAQVHEFLTKLGFEKLQGKHTFEGLKGKTGTGYMHPSLGKVVVESKAVSHQNPSTGAFIKHVVNTPAGMAKMQSYFTPQSSGTAMPSWWQGDDASWESYKSSVVEPPKTGEDQQTAQYMKDAADVLTNNGYLQEHTTFSGNVSYEKKIPDSEETENVLVKPDGSWKHYDTKGKVTGGLTIGDLQQAVRGPKAAAPAATHSWTVGGVPMPAGWEPQPKGMAEVYTTNLGAAYKWDGKNYVGNEGKTTFTDKQMQNKAAFGSMTPVLKPKTYGIAAPPAATEFKPAVVEPEYKDHPANMAQGYKSPVSGVLYQWDSAHEKYMPLGDAENFGKIKKDGFTSDQLNVKMGNQQGWEPVWVKEKNTGMANAYKSPLSGAVYRWNEKEQKFMPPPGSENNAMVKTGGYTISHMVEKINNENWLPHGKSEVSQHGNPPIGMAVQYQSPTGKIYEWNPETGNYHNDINQFKPEDKPATFKPVGPIVGKPGAGPPVARSPLPVISPVIPPGTNMPKATVGPVVNPGATLKPADFTYHQSKSEAGLGGAHDKYLFKDQSGADWMFKPAQTLGGAPDKLKAFADQVASKIQEVVHPGFAVKAEAISLNIPGSGEKFGSIQKMIPKEQLRGENAKFQDFTGRNFVTHPFQPWEVEHLQQEQVADWLISNHDSHEGQFLRVSSQYPGGRGVVGIDKTQAFRYFPKDMLNMVYQPNTVQYGEKPPLYNQMWKDAKAGTINFDPNDTLKAIKRVEAVSDSTYQAMLKPYADARYGLDEQQKKDFLKLAVDRKHNLRSDFENLFTQVTGSTFKFEAQPTGEGSIDVPYHHPTNPEPKFTEEHKAPAKEALYEQAALSLKQYGYKNPSSQLSTALMTQWQTKIGTGKTQAARIKAAEGLGVYPELAAKAGLGPQDMLKLQQGFETWGGSTTYDDPQNHYVSRLRQAAQELVQGKCCSDKIGIALAVEHAVTRAKLLQMHPDGYVPLTRALSGAVATKITDLAKKHPLINIKLLNAEGWSDNKGYGGSARIGANVHVDHIMSAYNTNKEAWESHSNEHEVMVAIPKRWMQFQSHNISGY